ncbi:MAG: tRNA lysidine(34) synthetase TilS [Candidatus Hinthialibacter antarcticus]|nr:tRNA lysidine(34) synthetase TilS [Candidatus Hinthialibacter antarcticus]
MTTYAYTFRERALNAIQRYGMLKKGARPLLAVSGGPDSVALLDVFSRLQDELNLDIHVCHVNHGLRGSASFEDERFVVQLTGRYILPLTVRRFEPDEIETIRAGNLEEEARNLRYQKLIHTAEELNLSPIVTGHTLSDQAETVLHRIVRSSGITGLSAIAPMRNDVEPPVVRPLISHTRDEIMQYIQEEKLEYCRDQMNEELAFTRVRIRKELLPLIRDTLNPNIEEALGRLACVAQEEETFWNQWIDGVHQQIGEAEEDSPADRERFLRLSRAEQRRLLRRYIQTYNVDLSFVNVDDSIELLMGEKPQGEIHISSEVRLYRRYDRFYFAGPSLPAEPMTEIVLKAPGVTVISDLRIEAVVQEFPAEVKHLPPQGAWVGEFDAGKVMRPITVRTRRDGDVIRPLGMSGTKKIKKILQEKQIPQEERERLPLVFMNNETAWAPGCCLSQSFCVDHNTQTILRIVIRKI